MEGKIRKIEADWKHRATEEGKGEGKKRRMYEEGWVSCASRVQIRALLRCEVLQTMVHGSIEEVCVMSTSCIPSIQCQRG